MFFFHSWRAVPVICLWRIRFFFISPLISSRKCLTPFSSDVPFNNSLRKSRKCLTPSSSDVPFNHSSSTSFNIGWTVSSVKCLGLHLYSWCHQKLPVASRRLLPSKLTLFPDKLAFLSFWFQWQFSAFRRPSWNAKLQILPAVLMTLSSTLLHSWPVCSRTEEMYPENNRKKGIRLPFRISLKNNNSLPSLLISGVGERMRSYLYFVFCSWLFCYQLVVQIMKIQKRIKKKNVNRGKNVSKFW